MLILAARLCSAAEPNQVLISEDTLNQPGIKEAVEAEKLEEKHLKGFTDPIAVYQVRRIK